MHRGGAPRRGDRTGRRVESGERCGREEIRRGAPAVYAELNVGERS